MHATVMYSREALTSVGGFNERLHACEDYEVYLQIARHREVNQHAALVAEYRQHATNMSYDNMLMLQAVLRVLRRERQYVRDSEGRAALRRGVATWKRYYADREIQSWSKKTARQHARLLLALIRWYPGGIARYALKFMNRRMRTWVSSQEISMGSLRRLTPVSRQFGYDRGEPVDRYYIESFLRQFDNDIQGRVLEVGDDSYSRRFGRDRITRQDVLHISDGHRGATIIGSLEDAPQIPSEQFNCVILTQTLHLIYDLRAAFATLYRILKPEGVLLVTLPGISQICHDRACPERDSWRFTAYSAKRLFTEYFPQNEVHVQSYGNVLTATAFLYGLASREVKRVELDHVDPDYPVILGIRARKPKSLSSA
jgi:SAM-dependent methyltransferase